MDHIIKIIKSLENSGVLLDGVIEAKKHEGILKKRRRTSWLLVRNFRCSDVRKYVGCKSCTESWKKVKQNRSKFLVSLYPLSNIEITKCFNYERTFSIVFQKIIYLE